MKPIFRSYNDVYQVIKDDYSEIDIHILQLPKANLSDGWEREAIQD